MGKRTGIILIIAILMVITGCSRIEPLKLKTGQRLVEITKDDRIEFVERYRISRYEYNAKAFEQFVDQFYYGNYRSLDQGTSIFGADGSEMKAADTEAFSDSIIVSFDKRSVKNSRLYVQVPGEINFIISSDQSLDFELIRPGLLQIISWQNESSANLVFTPSQVKTDEAPEGNYCIYDYTDYRDSAYTETISFNLADYENKSLGLTLEDYFQSAGFENYGEIARLYGLQWIATEEAVFEKQLKKSRHAKFAALGNIGGNLYVRVPGDILMVSDETRYDYIDASTIWVKEGQATLVFD